MAYPRVTGAIAIVTLIESAGVSIATALCAPVSSVHIKTRIVTLVKLLGSWIGRPNIGFPLPLTEPMACHGGRV